MKILFIIPGLTGRYNRPSSPPVGIGYLSAVLKKKGHSIRALDLRVKKTNYDYISAIKEFSPDMVGVSFMSDKYISSYDLIDNIKSNTGAIVVIGGAHPSVMKEDVLRECRADYAIYGEGEYLVVKKLITKVAGKGMAEIMSVFCRMKFFRKAIMGLGMKAAPAILQYINTRKKNVA